ncbi:hypothetical protein [Flavobacterium algicola]|uniref:hypothetical protein n=1 Tax=Flavobacterium algicola TaxID=556529 RepID=UPI001EFD4AA6|nr:hypothetical protein [Flavobacterium algicola]MCG9790962.1 hypothetical protein [Flavobacterium algicola]
MKRIRLSNIILFTFILIATTTFFSCQNIKKDALNVSIQEMSPDVTSTLDFNSLSYLNEANKKVIDISSMIFYQSKHVPHLKLILKVKEDHQRNDRDFKELTKKNLTIVPKPFYQLNLNKDSLDSENSTNYLVKLLISEINLQINLLEDIKNSTTNPEFKTFAEKSALLMKQNSKMLGTTFKLKSI